MCPAGQLLIASRYNVRVLCIPGCVQDIEYCSLTVCVSKGHSTSLPLTGRRRAAGRRRAGGRREGSYSKPMQRGGRSPSDEEEKGILIY